jgi:hypothetical protein
VILEYEVHGKILSTGLHYDNSFISVVTIDKRKIVHRRDYMDSLAAWTALNSTTESENSPVTRDSKRKAPPMRSERSSMTRTAIEAL